MKQTTIDNIINRLWPTETPVHARRVYAMLDGARDEQIEPMVRSSNLPHDCLYREPLTDSLRAAAPHIIELNANAKFTQQLLKKGWGQSWGIFLIAPPRATLPIVRNIYRKINKVQAPSGQSVFFRYYDPRVLRAYLPTCKPAEIEAVFGSVTEIVLEGEEATQLQSFKHNKNTDEVEFFNV